MIVHTRIHVEMICLALLRICIGNSAHVNWAASVAKLAKHSV